MDCSSPGSSVLGILQARKLEWIVIFFSRGSSQPRDLSWVSCTAGRFFSVWATREVYVNLYVSPTLDWVSYPFSSGPSWPRNQTGVSCTGGRFFTNWAIREAHVNPYVSPNYWPLLVSSIFKRCMLSHFSPVGLFAIPWTVAHQAPLSMRFSRQEYGVGRRALLQGLFSTQGPNLHLLFSCVGRRVHHHWATADAPF